MMESWRTLTQNGKTAKGKPVVLSPQLEDYDFFHYVRHPLKPLSDEFYVLLNVVHFELNQIEVLMPKEGELEIRAKHDIKKNPSRSLEFSRDCVYRYVLPKEVAKRELIAHWTDDNFLLIQPTDTNCEGAFKAPYRLVIERVPRLLKPSVDIRVLKEMVEDIRDKANYTLRYIRLQTYMPPESVDLDGIVTNSGSVSYPTSEASEKFEDEKAFSNANSPVKDESTNSQTPVNSNGIVTEMEKPLKKLNETIADLEKGKACESTQAKCSKTIKSPAK